MNREYTSTVASNDDEHVVVCGAASTNAEVEVSGSRFFRRAHFTCFHPPGQEIWSTRETISRQAFVSGFLICFCMTMNR